MNLFAGRWEEKYGITKVDLEALQVKRDNEACNGVPEQCVRRQLAFRRSSAELPDCIPSCTLAPCNAHLVKFQVLTQVLAYFSKTVQKQRVFKQLDSTNRGKIGPDDLARTFQRLEYEPPAVTDFGNSEIEDMIWGNPASRMYKTSFVEDESTRNQSNFIRLFLIFCLIPCHTMPAVDIQFH